MNALDTNILVRYFMDNPFDVDDIRQRQIAQKVLKQPCYISLSVILEMVWVLKSRYKLTRFEIVQAITLLCQASNIMIENQSLLVRATAFYQQGMDFADALHLLHASQCDKFLTFDQKFIKKASKLQNHLPVIEPT